MTEILSPVGVQEGTTTAGSVVGHPAWPVLKNAVETIRPWQSKDGSVDLEAEGAPSADAVRTEVDRVIAALGELAPLLPHNAAYHQALAADLRRWADGGFGVPDFLDSLLAFQPAQQRADGLQHLVLFPMYTQNGNPDRNFEAVVLRMVWPDWLAELERTRYDNALFCGITFEDFTAGYDTNSAVLFPETIAVREAPERFSWGGIFCDREAARFRRVSQAAVDTLGLELPKDIGEMLADQERCQEAFVLWDMVHDRTHSHGDLPFDPFMIKQRQPFWMYGLEELRCDLTAFKEAVKLEAEGYAQARDVQFAVIFDRMFRFPVTGDRVRNYDGLGGQLLFAYLHKHDVVRWTDNTLHIDWERAPKVTKRAVRRDRKALPRRHRPAQAGPLVRRVRPRLDLPRTAPGVGLGQGARRPRPGPAAAQTRGRRAPRRVPAEYVLRGARQEAACCDRIHQGHHGPQR